MRRLNLIISVSVFLAGILLTSCSDNSTNDPVITAADYYKMNVGNYWVYQIDETDSNNVVNPDATTTDSSVVEATINYFGKPAHVVVHYNSDGSSDTSYFAIDGSKLYTYMSELGNDQFGVPYGGWILLGDKDGTTWTIIDTNVTTPVEVQPGTTADLTAQVKLSGAKLPDENVTYNSSSVSCLVFSQTALINGTLDMGLKIPITQTITVKYYFGKKIGLIKAVQPATSIALPIIGKLPIPGFLQTLQRHKVS
jgi:hypothetical protein